MPDHLLSAEGIEPRAVLDDLGLTARLLVGPPASMTCDHVFVERHFGSDRYDLMASTWRPHEGRGLAEDLGIGWLAEWDALGPVPMVWLEWDRPSITVREPLSSACTSDGILAGRALRRGPGNAAERDRLLADLLASMGHEPCLEGLCTLVGLDPAVRLLHVASLRPRGREVLRTTWGMRGRDLGRWMRSLPLPDPPHRELAGLLAASAPPHAILGVQLELTPTLGPYVALETPERLQPRSGGDALRRWLVDHGLPDRPDLWQAILDWPGGRGGWTHSAYVKVAREPSGWVAKSYFGRGRRGHIAADQRSGSVTPRS